MAVQAIPKGYHSVTPLISVKGAARLIDFLKATFGAEELSRIPAPDGTIMHAEVKIGDSIVMLGEEMEGSPSTPAALYIYVPDSDVTYGAAMDAGAESLEGPSDRFWGDRMASIKDFAGNKWWIATHLEDVNADELKRRIESMAA